MPMEPVHVVGEAVGTCELVDAAGLEKAALSVLARQQAVTPGSIERPPWFTAMTTGATDSNDRKASWSNYGTCVDWFAPGVSITSSWYTSSTATNTNHRMASRVAHAEGCTAGRAWHVLGQVAG